jgi:hypothetical protein
MPDETLTNLCSVTQFIVKHNEEFTLQLANSTVRCKTQRLWSGVDTFILGYSFLMLLFIPLIRSW